MFMMTYNIQCVYVVNAYWSFQILLCVSSLQAVWLSNVKMEHILFDVSNMSLYNLGLQEKKTDSEDKGVDSTAYPRLQKLIPKISYWSFGCFLCCTIYF